MTDTRIYLIHLNVTVYASEERNIDEIERLIADALEVGLEGTTLAAGDGRQPVVIADVEEV